MTALSATVGTGNIAGVATAIFLGGPGAIFWMWLTALVGMATKYAEAFLAIFYRDRNKQGNYVGGPMYYIKNGLEKKYHFLAYAFAFFGMIAAFGIGNGVQSNSVAQVVSMELNISQVTVGFIIAILVMLVILGGIKSIGKTAAKLVPAMSLIYILGGLYIIIINIDLVPTVFWLIIDSAFTTTAASGGFAGATVWGAIRYGVSRGVFSNEAGLGTSDMAHGAAQTKEPVREGLVAMIEPFIDTIVVCTITAMVILSSGVWQDSSLNGVTMTTTAFIKELGGFGKFLLLAAVLTFSLSTMMSYSYYGSKCSGYLFGTKSIFYYRCFYIITIVVGAMITIDVVINLVDGMYALMAIPTVVGSVLLSGKVMEEARRYFSTLN